MDGRCPPAMTTGGDGVLSRRDPIGSVQELEPQMNADSVEWVVVGDQRTAVTMFVRVVRKTWSAPRLRPGMLRRP